MSCQCRHYTLTATCGSIRDTPYHHHHHPTPPVCRRIRASFSPEIVQAGGSEGVKIVHVGIRSATARELHGLKLCMSYLFCKRCLPSSPGEIGMAPRDWCVPLLICDTTPRVYGSDGLCISSFKQWACFWWYCSLNWWWNGHPFVRFVLKSLLIVLNKPLQSLMDVVRLIVLHRTPAILC